MAKQFVTLKERASKMETQEETEIRGVRSKRSQEIEIESCIECGRPVTYLDNFGYIHIDNPSNGCWLHKAIIWK